MIETNAVSSDEVEGATGDTQSSARPGKYMTFRIDNEDYGVEILSVREIIGMMDITRVPRAPSFIRGVINLRGKVMPVWDLRKKFGMSPTETTDQTVIIVVQCANGDRLLTTGVVVDEVLEVLTLTAKQIAETPDFNTCAFDARFIIGVGKVESRMIFLLDIARVITSEEGEVLAQIASDSPKSSAERGR